MRWSMCKRAAYTLYVAIALESLYLVLSQAPPDFLAPPPSTGVNEGAADINTPSTELYSTSLGLRTPAPSSQTDASPTSKSRPPPRGSFVTRDGIQLMLDGKPFYFTGSNYYSAMVDASGGPYTRPQIVAMFKTMQNLGLTVLRTWAFNDFGENNTWQALQTEPKVFSQQVFSEGLDWIISEAPKYGIKLLLTLTNYQLGYGGAIQYVRWAKGTSILDFFTNPSIDEWYKNNIATIVTRTNTITGLQYRDDPAILGWELINEPRVPGDDTGTVLTKWIESNSAYLKTLDSNHLVGVGVEGFYGQSTPHRLADNPQPGLSPTSNGGSPAPYAGICEGQDFFANHEPEGIDFTSIHIYPDYWATTNLTFQLSFVSQFITGHMEESAKLGKPLFLGEFGKYPPIRDRNAMFELVYALAAKSAAEGGVLAGTLVWTLANNPEFPYVNGFDAFNIYPTAEAYLQPPPGNYSSPTQLALANAKNAEFFGWAEQTACNRKYVTNPRGLLKDAPSLSDGWDETLAIIRKAAEATSGKKPKPVEDGNEEAP